MAFTCYVVRVAYENGSAHFQTNPYAIVQQLKKVRHLIKHAPMQNWEQVSLRTHPRNNAPVLKCNSMDGNYPFGF